MNDVRPPLHRAFAGLGEYGFVRLARAKAERLAHGLTLLDFATGDLRERTPQFIRDALREAVEERSAYPPAAGIPELRRAAAGWVERRFGVELDLDRHLLPTNGSKEALFSIHQMVLDHQSGRNVVVVPDPAYPVYEIGAAFAGADVVRVPLQPDRGFLPDLDAVAAEVWARTALLWINYPNSPTGAVAPPDFFESAVAHARQHGFWLASDEAYAEIYFEAPPPSVLQHGLENVIAFHSLSKRSAMTGYRSGFLAGDPRLIENLARVRPSQGVATPSFVQEAAVVAWQDDAHAERQRSLVAEKRAILEPALLDRGLRIDGSAATFYLYVRVPEGETSESFADRLLEASIAVAPGSFFGPSGEGWVRFALVPPLEECRDAAAILRGMS